MISEGKPTTITLVSWPDRTIKIMFLLIGWGIAVGSRPPGVKRGPAVTAYLAVVTLVSIWLFYRIWRMRVDFDDYGVTIHKLLRTYRSGWPEVSHLADGAAWWSSKGGWFLASPWALKVVLRDGRAVTAGSTMGWKDSASPKVLATIRQVAELYAVPAQLTGTPMKGGLPTVPGLYPDPGGKPGLRSWDGRKWSPFLRPDPAISGPKGEKAPAEVWSPLPGSEQYWQDSASRARRVETHFAVGLAVTAVTAAVTVVLYWWSLSKPHAYFTPAKYAGLATLICLGLVVIGPGMARKEYRKVAQAAKAAAGLDSTANNTASPHGDRGEDPNS